MVETGARPTRILVVEDSASARRIMQELLLDMGATAQNLRLASSAQEALGLISDWPPDLVFLDIELQQAGGTPVGAPRTRSGKAPSAPVNGDELGHELLKDNPHRPLVVVTALDAENPRVQGLRKQGPVEVIVKPVRAARVQEVLQRFGVRLPSAG